MSKIASAVALGLAGLGLLVAGCGDNSKGGGTGGGGGGAKAAGSVGVDFPRADSDFWNSYNSYVPKKAGDLGVKLLPPTNSDNDI
jgi:ribose transport system substrate-binding protein